MYTESRLKQNCLLLFINGVIISIITVFLKDLNLYEK